MGILKNILAVIAGIIVGSVVNMGLVMLGPMIIASPMGLDLTTEEGLKLAMPLMEVKHFIFPFLAHALGTLAGAIVAAKIAVTHKMSYAISIGALFLIGGIMMVISVSGPVWFSAVDLILAYIPMGYLGGILVLQNQPAE